MQTLEELKAENAAAEAEALAASAAESEEVEVEVEDEDDIDGDDAAEHDDKGSDSNSDDWMQEVEDQDSGGSDEKMVPVGAISKVRQKFRGQLEKKDSEINELRQQLERLQAPNGNQHSTQVKPAPTLADFDYDESKYAAALQDHLLSTVDSKIAGSAQQAEERRKYEAAKRAHDEALDEHYHRAEKFCKANSISDADYKAADTKLRQAVEEVMPNRGDTVVDALLASLGDDSEKVAFYLGRNRPAREEMQRLMVADPSGIKLSIWLGKKAKELSPPIKIKSSAPKPNTQMTGTDTAGDPNKDLLAKIARARKTGDMQKVIDLKFEAKARGIDTRAL